MANTDFLMREAREVLEGPMAVARFGTCGVIEEKVPAGDIIIPESAVYVQQNYDYNHEVGQDDSKAFFISKPCVATLALHQLLTTKFEVLIGKEHVHNYGLNATCDTFYSCQGI